tara:strand:- start:142 stop:630 length:489 start_codon:yes stop_codon:yes gene_type:complete
MTGSNTFESAPVLSIVEFCILIISFVLFLVAQIEELALSPILIIYSFVIYFLLATYRMAFQFDLSFISGISASVITVFSLSSMYWIMTGANFFGDGAIILLFLVFIIPGVLLATLSKKFKDLPNWSRFVIGSFCSLPFSLLAVVVSLGIVGGFIEGNLDDWG